MPFRLMRNKTQDVAVKGFLVTLVVTILLALFKVVPFDITAPFLLLWIMVWMIGASANTKSS